MLFYRLFGGLYLLKSGTHRTFPVLRNIPGKVPLFLMSSVFPYSKGEQGRYGELLFSQFLSYSIVTQVKKIYKFKKI